MVCRFRALFSLVFGTNSCTFQQECLVWPLLSFYGFWGLQILRVKKLQGQGMLNGPSQSLFKTPWGARCTAAVLHSKWLSYKGHLTHKAGLFKFPQANSLERVTFLSKCLQKWVGGRCIFTEKPLLKAGNGVISEILKHHIDIVRKPNN